MKKILYSVAVEGFEIDLVAGVVSDHANEFTEGQTSYFGGREGIIELGRFANRGLHGIDRYAFFDLIDLAQSF